VFGKDPEGDNQFYKFKVAFDREFDRRVEAGDDEMELLDPQSPKYMGGMVDGYRRTQKDVFRSMTEEALRQAPSPSPPETAAPTSPPVAAQPAWKPGEPLDEYLKRIGKL
jgi:hypothetical protein